MERNPNDIIGMKFKYNNGSETKTAIIVMADEDIGLTAVNADDKYDYLICLAHPSVRQGSFNEAQYPQAYKYITSRAILGKVVKSEILGYMRRRQVFGFCVSPSNCVFNR